MTTLQAEDHFDRSLRFAAMPVVSSFSRLVPYLSLIQSDQMLPMLKMDINVELVFGSINWKIEAGESALAWTLINHPTANKSSGSSPFFQRQLSEALHNVESTIQLRQPVTPMFSTMPFLKHCIFALTDALVLKLVVINDEERKEDCKSLLY
ncbi:hypothetical protein Tco_0324449 [Tanacetum coccineum]